MSGVRCIFGCGRDLCDLDIRVLAEEDSTEEYSSERDQELALALLAGDPDALREAEACALADKMPLSNIARLLIMAAQRGREATKAQHCSRARVAASWEAALLSGGALDAQDQYRIAGDPASQ